MTKKSGWFSRNPWATKILSAVAVAVVIFTIRSVMAKDHERPLIQQSTAGTNSPAVVGSGNVFNYSAGPDVRTLPPHALTEEQRAAIAEKAKGSGAELEIVSIIGDVEAKNISDDIAAALRSVDWTVQQSTLYFIQKPNQPLVVSVPDREHPPAAADALIRGLQAAGLPVEGEGGLDRKPGRIKLRIGERAGR